MNSIYTYETVDKLVCILHQKNTGVKIVFIFLDSWIQLVKNNGIMK